MKPSHRLFLSIVLAAILVPTLDWLYVTRPTREWQQDPRRLRDEITYRNAFWQYVSYHTNLPDTGLNMPAWQIIAREISREDWRYSSMLSFPHSVYTPATHSWFFGTQTFESWDPGDKVVLNPQQFKPEDQSLEWIMNWKAYRNVDHAIYDYRRNIAIERGKSGVMNSGFTRLFSQELATYKKYGLTGILLPTDRPPTATKFMVQTESNGMLLLFPFSITAWPSWLFSLLLVAILSAIFYSLMPVRQHQLPATAGTLQSLYGELRRVHASLQQISSQYPKGLPELDRCDILLKRLAEQIGTTLTDERAEPGMPDAHTIEKARTLMGTIEAFLEL